MITSFSFIVCYSLHTSFKSNLDFKILILIFARLLWFQKCLSGVQQPVFFKTALKWELIPKDCLMMYQNLLKTDVGLAAKCISDFGFGYREMNKTIHLVWHLPSASMSEDHSRVPKLAVMGVMVQLKYIGSQVIHLSTRRYLYIPVNEMYFPENALSTKSFIF